MSQEEQGSNPDAEEVSFPSVDDAPVTVTGHVSIGINYLHKLIWEHHDLTSEKKNLERRMKIILDQGAILMDENRALRATNQSLLDKITVLRMTSLNLQDQTKSKTDAW